MSDRLPPLFSLLLVALLLAACGGEAPAPWTEVAEDALSPEQRKQRAKAFEAKDAMFKALSGRLMAAMGEGGPAAAIEVCRAEAPAIAKRVSEEQGVVISRTSHRLRNPANTPPTWAAPFVEAQRDTNVYAAHPDGRLGALLPIRLQNACLGCHGAAEELSEEVNQTLGAHYPDDAATGFARGDLRGWFVVVVPP